MTADSATRGCYCGAAKYLQSGEPEQVLACHCQDCCRSVGAQSVGWLIVCASEFEWLAGTPRHFQSSLGVIRTFCGACGMALTWGGQEHPGRIDVTIGSLDDHNRFVPTRAVYRRHKVKWVSEI